MCCLVQDGAEGGCKGRGFGVEVDEDKRTPGLNPHREEAEASLVEVLNTLELGSGHQVAVESIGPAMVATLQRLAIALACSHVARPVSTDVVESAQLAVCAPRDY